MEIMRISGADVVPAGPTVNNQGQQENTVAREKPEQSEKVKESTIDTYA